MRIAISSKSGCGNTTVSTLLAKRLGYKIINFTFRQMAQERGVDFWTLCRMAENDYEIDRELDRRQVEMAKKEEDCILASRLAIWMLKDADLSVYLSASALTRAERIQKREGGELEERLLETENRDRNDSVRYKKIYGIDNSKPEKVADLIIETDERNPDEICDIIIKELEKKRNGKD